MTRFLEASPVQPEAVCLRVLPKQFQEDLLAAACSLQALRQLLPLHLQVLANLWPEAMGTAPARQHCCRLLRHATASPCTAAMTAFSTPSWSTAQGDAHLCGYPTHVQVMLSRRIRSSICCRCHITLGDEHTTHSSMGRRPCKWDQRPGCGGDVHCARHVPRDSRCNR